MLSSRNFAELGKRALEAMPADGYWTLAILLDDPNTLKGLWHVRNDAASLCRCHEVKPKGSLTFN